MNIGNNFKIHLLLSRPVAEEKAADEVYCTTCGELIKKEAEICPNCGVRNENSSKYSGSNPSNYNTSVSGNWWMGIGLSMAGQIILVSLVILDTNPIAGIAALITSIPLFLLMPVSIYMDAKYVRANSNWNPKIPVWIMLSLIAGLITGIAYLIVGIAYLIKRHGELGTP